MPAKLVFRRKTWDARDNGIPLRSIPGLQAQRQYKKASHCTYWEGTLNKTGKREEYCTRARSSQINCSPRRSQVYACLRFYHH